MAGIIVPEPEMLANLRQSVAQQVCCLNKLKKEFAKFRIACDVSADRFVAMDTLMNDLTRQCNAFWRMINAPKHCETEQEKSRG